MVDAHTNKLEYMQECMGTFKSTASYYQYSMVMTIKGFNIEQVKIQTTLIAIDFSRNNFTGDIPESIGKLNSLKGLNFSHNKLTGKFFSQQAN